MQDLVALRDGEGSSAAREHLAVCEACQGELELLHQRVAALRALPALRAPRDRWPMIRDAALAARRRGFRVKTAWISLAAAASLALLVGVRVVGNPSQGAGAVTLDELMTQSQDREQALRALDPTSRVLNGRTAGAIADLEDRIAVIDARLGDRHTNNLGRDEIMELWRQRVDLMDALINLHMTRAAYVGL
jgi:hypothetical protein